NVALFFTGSITRFGLRGANRSTEDKMKFILATGALAFSSLCFASPINVVASDGLVQNMVTSLATQSLSGDPVYCSFDKPKEIQLKDTANDTQYQVEI